MMLDSHRPWTNIADLLSWCDEFRVDVVTLWLPGDRLDAVHEAVDTLSAAPARWRLRVIGSLDLLPAPAAARLAGAVARTAGHTGMQVNVAVCYDGRREVAHAVREVLAEHAGRGSSIDEVADHLDVDQLAGHMYTSGQPDPDLVIRMSPDQCLEGFLLWQAVRSEFWFWDGYPAAFRKVDFLRALRDFGARSRRFGA